MRIVNFILAILFLLFAFVQIDDPDPVIWILIYGSMAVLSILAAFRIFHLRVILALLVSLTVYSFFHLPGLLEWLQSENKAELFDDLAKMNHLYIEESREFLGLVICIAALSAFLYQSKKFKKS